MSSVSISDIQFTNQIVSADMFGANLVYETTQNGAPLTEFEEAANALGVQNIRFGGGQADLDPGFVNEEGELPVDGETAINILEMPGGQLRPEVVNFLEWVEARNQEGRPTQATLIIPTKHLTTEVYAELGMEISDFVNEVMREYGDLIAAFQIGNEHWEMGETAYGQKASIAAVAIEEGLDRAGIPNAMQPEIIIQMATAGNLGSEFQPGEAEPGFLTRNALANEQIIKQLSPEAVAAIDGVTEHYYYNYAGLELPQDLSDLRNIDQDYAIWDAAFSKELTLHITEWNIRTTTTSQQGLVAASTLLHQFENMVATGVDSAHIWTLDYHSRTALTLEGDGGARLDDQGRVLNSAQGAVFDLMAASLSGKELLDLSLDAELPGIAVSAYASEGEATIYLSSRSLEVEQFRLDLGNGFGALGPVSGVQLSLDRESTNGQQWERGEAASSITVDGAAYYYDEHDADVILTDLLFLDPQAIEVALKPFEVLELTLSLDGLGELDTGHLGQVFEPAQYVPGIAHVSGGDGLDTLALDMGREELTIVPLASGQVRIESDALDQTVTLENVERLALSDGFLALDTDGIAGEAYRLYQASFDRVPDAPGLQFWIGHLDQGRVSLVEAARHFLTSAEFETAYGRNAQLANNEFLDLLYLNVLDRLPDEAGYAFWEVHQENGLAREDMLVYFSESNENKANTAEQISDGIWFGL